MHKYWKSKGCFLTKSRRPEACEISLTVQVKGRQVQLLIGGNTIGLIAVKSSSSSWQVHCSLATENRVPDETAENSETCSNDTYYTGYGYG